MKYSTIAEVYDLGPFVSKIVLELEQPVTGCELDREAFRVHVERKDRETGEVIQIPKAWGSQERFPSVGERRVLNAYLSDRDGNRVRKGSFITLELEVDPRIPLGSTIAFDGTFNVRVDCAYTVTQEKTIDCGDFSLDRMVFDEPDQNRTLLADEFVTGKSTYQGIQLTYAAFQPEKNGEKRPLLIWLHGAGEGGTDPIVAVSGNKVTNLISDGIQRFFGGSYVLGPQSPTVWMDDGTGRIGTDGSSIYVESLKNLIDEFIAAHDDIDRRRIYIGGCSNGGFMTLKMIIAYPQTFAAAFPICEALADACVTDGDIDRIRDIPIWFVHAENDPVVDIKRYAQATYRRLLEAGACRVHFSCFPSITDRTGKYWNADHTPYEYIGHFSWIPALNNECKAECPEISGRTGEITLFEWLSLQEKR